MKTALFNRYFPTFNIRNGLAKVLGSSLAIGSLVAMNALPTTANPGQTPAKSNSIGAQLEANRQLTAAAKGPNTSLPDGVYLYGQAPQPGQVGMGYFVFEVNRGNVVGALYMPRSSFDCASGSFVGNQLALTVVNSYDRATNPFQIAVEKTANVASNKPAGNEIGLQGFHRISTISQNDRRILNVCKADLRK